MIRPRAFLALGWGALLALCAGLGGWAGLARLDGGVLVAGEVEITRLPETLQHDTLGTVSKILVTDGTYVAAGQVLIRLDPGETDARIVATQARIAALTARAARLRAELEGSGTMTGSGAATSDWQREARLLEARHAAWEQERAQLGARSRQLDARIDGLIRQRSSLARQRDLIRAELQRLSPLRAEGLITARQIAALELESAQLDGRDAGLDADIAGARAGLGEIEMALGRLDNTRRADATAELSRIAPDLENLRQELRTLQTRRARHDIRAPLAGRVHDLRIAGPGAVVRPAEPLLSLLPEVRDIRIAARIPPGKIDHVHIGQQVRLQRATLAGRMAPAEPGHVEQISADTLFDRQRGETYYRAVIRPDPDQATGLPPPVPGLPVDVTFVTGARTPLALLMSPLTRYFRAAFLDG